MFVVPIERSFSICVECTALNFEVATVDWIKHICLNFYPINNYFFFLFSASHAILNETMFPRCGSAFSERGKADSLIDFNRMK